MPEAAAADAGVPVINNKTLVAWVTVANLTQHGGSVQTLDDQQQRFDGIIFGEISPAKWMAGSDGFTRTNQTQDAYPPETADPQTVVQVAIVYEGTRITVYRNGREYASHDAGGHISFGPGSVVVMGLRHLSAGDRACFAGSIEDARIYDRALNATQIAALQPNQPSDPEPLAWWTFEDGSAADKTGRFTEVLLVGDARVSGGRLHLGGKESFLVCAPAGTVLPVFGRARQATDVLTTGARALRERLLADPQRPTYHFVSPEGHCMPFDPNGALFWRGKYHLCYIFQDERGHCWGHVSSTDLVHWRWHTPALFPSPGDPDTGIFSGNGFISKQGEAVLLYHGVGAGNCIALSTEDELDHWTKLPTNPIVPSPQPGSPEAALYSSWDPHGWLEGDTYYAIFGGNPSTLFKSDDLVHWRFLHRIPEQNMPDVEPDEDISCPDFFKLGNKHMLLCISHKRGCRYYLGTWEGEQFRPDFHARMNWPGGACFAPESLEDDRGRRIMWAWALDGSPGEGFAAPEWSGVMTLPRLLTLPDDGVLRIQPVPELEMLRLNHRRVEGLAVGADAEVAVKQVRGDCLELAAEIQPGDAKEFGLKVRCSPGGEEQTVILYDPARKLLRVEFDKSSENPVLVRRTYCCPTGPDNPAVTAQEAPFELQPGEPLKLRVFLDRSIIEVFANDRQCLTQRVYPVRKDSLGVALVSRGGTTTATSLDAWDMMRANPW